MNKSLIISFAMWLPLAAYAQNIDFESDTEYKSVGVYDTWEESPFRTGELKGNVQVVDNFLYEGNRSSKILGLQRSRFGSNTFGVRIDLNKPFPITPKTCYVHVKINRPVTGKVMLVGLGKRSERAAQSAETEQFWVYSENDIVPDKWNDAVFAVRGNKGVDIYSLVVVPDCTSPHNLKKDFAVYFDDIDINTDESPRIEVGDVLAESSHDEGSYVMINAGSRNGYITDEEGRELTNVKIPGKRAFRIKAVPAPGFSLKHVTVRGRNIENVVYASEFDGQGCFIIPSEWITSDISIEGEFKNTEKR